MSQAAFDHAFEAVKALHKAAGLDRFVAFPEDARRADVIPYHIPAAERMVADAGKFIDAKYADATQSLIALHADIEWRVTYRDTHLEEDYRNRFACYKLIGTGSPFETTQMGGYLLYTTANLDYPWHHHPAEELYLILGGEAEFQAEGARAQTLRPGDTVQHASNQPHRMTTFESPVLCWVLWRPPHMDVTPVLTEREVRT